MWSIVRYDDAGWAVDPVTAWPLADCWSLLAPDDVSRMDEPRWKRNAERFFSAELRLLTPKHYVDAMPRADVAIVQVASTEVRVQTLPIDGAVLRAGQAAAAAIGGAGFDVLVKRTKRLWQVDAHVNEGDPRAPLLLTAVLASVLLAPVLPPEGGEIFGVKGCRERLMVQGWR
jgi:hypothetical protein